MEHDIGQFVEKGQAHNWVEGLPSYARLYNHSPHEAFESKSKLTVHEMVNLM